MPEFTITMGDPLTGRAGRVFSVDAPSLSEAYVGVYADPDAIGLVPVDVAADACAPDSKRCGCPPGGLTRAVTLWECAACGHVQGARRRICEGCQERKRPATEQPHQDHVSFSPQCERGEYTNRRGQRVCVGCQKEIPGA